MADETSDAPKIEPRLRSRLVHSAERHHASMRAARYGGLFPDERHMVLEDDLLTALRRRSDGYPLFHLQIRLLQDLLIAQRTIKALKRAAREADEEPAPGGGEARDGFPKDPRSGGESEDDEPSVLLNRAHVSAVRDIADGIAWRLLEYDRGLLYMLADRPEKGHIDLDGLEAELFHFCSAFETGEGIPILNDVTHFLKLGDVTVCRGGGQFDILEIKKGPQRSRRITRQKNAMARVMTLFNCGQVDMEEETVHVAELDVTPETYMRHLERLLLAAEKQGAAASAIGDHLFVGCVDFSSQAPNLRDRLKSVIDAERARVERWEADEDLVLPVDSFDHYAFVRNTAPFAVYPILPRLRVKLMTRAIVYRTTLNISAVMRYLHARGWDILRRPETAAVDAMARGELRRGSLGTIAKGAFRLEIPPAFVARLSRELLRPRSLADLFEAMYRRGPRGEDALLPVLAGEAAAWD